MNIVDVIVLIIILLGAVIGLKRGFIHSVVAFAGTILVVVLSFLFKNYVSVILYENLPFFKFNGLFRNITVVNILIYELIAFLITAIILSVLLKLFIYVSKIIEKILKATIILSIPSKIAGAIVGAVEGYVIAFVFIYIVSLPIFDFKELHESKYCDGILENTPVLSNIVSDSVYMLRDFEVLKNDYYSYNKTANEFNLEALDLFLKYKIVSVESVDRLVARDKLQITNIESVLSKYREVFHGSVN